MEYTSSRAETDLIVIEIDCILSRCKCIKHISCLYLAFCKHSLYSIEHITSFGAVRVAHLLVFCIVL
jgi:hypothetical protein